MTLEPPENYSTQAMTISNKLNPKLFELLVCPVTKAELIYDEEAQELISIKASLAYPVRQGIPVMLTEEARELTDADHKKYSKRK